MEVTHANEFNTHAILGGGEAEVFGIEQNAQFVTMLSVTLYSNAFLAVAREVICNAWDAHKISDKRDIPVKITLDDNYLTIRDFGPGIPHNKMVKTYCVYGGTTKRKSEKETGGFGLGAKAPFAYGDHFTVTNHYDGIMQVRAMSRGTEETGGMPVAPVMVEVPTTETGVEVKIPIKAHSDIQKFADTIRKVVYFGNMNVEMNGTLLPRIDFRGSDFIITPKTPPTPGGILYVRYGDVVYPIPDDDFYQDSKDAVVEAINQGTKKHSDWGGWSGSLPEFNLIMDAGPNSISVTPSRESLHTSTRTKETVLELLNKFLSRCNAVDTRTLLAEAEKSVVDKLIADPTYDIKELLYEPNLLAAYLAHNEGWNYQSTREIAFTDVRRFALFKAAHGCYDDEYEETGFTFKYKLKVVLKHKPDDAYLLRKLFKHINVPLVSDIDEATAPKRAYYFDNLHRRMTTVGIEPRFLKYWDRYLSDRRDLPVVKNPEDLTFLFRDLIDLTNSVMYYATNRTELKRHADWHRRYGPVRAQSAKNMRRVFMAPARKTFDHDHVIRFFQKQGYIVVDCREPAKPAAKRAPAPRASYERKKKPTGWVKLSAILAGDTIKLGMLNSTVTPIDPSCYVKKPKAVIRVRGNRKGDRNVFAWADYKAKIMAKYYGNDIVLALTDVQYAKALMTGAVDAYEYIVNDVIDFISKCDSYAKQANERFHIEDVQIASQHLFKLKKSIPGFENLPVTTTNLTEIETDFFDMLDVLNRHHNSLRSDLELAVMAAWEKQSLLIDHTKPNPILEFLHPDYAIRSKMLSFGNVLATALDEEEIDHIPTRMYATTLLQLALLR